MANIYGSQRGILLESRLVNSYDEADFNVKLVSLAHIWDNLVLGFHKWFSKNWKVLFCESVILSARQELGIEDRFYTNGLELKQLQKKKLREEEVSKEVAAVTLQLQEWIKEFHTEQIRSLRGLEKYRLAPGFDNFLIEPTKWNKMSVENQEKHVKKFLNFTPSSYNSYMKPKTVGLKSSPRPKRSRQPESELFNDRITIKRNTREIGGFTCWFEVYMAGI